MGKKIAVRHCIGCGSMKSKDELIRIIRDSEDNIFIDCDAKKNGRGAYICRNLSCLKKTVKSRGLSRALKVEVPDSIYEELERELSKDENK